MAKGASDAQTFFLVFQSQCLRGIDLGHSPSRFFVGVSRGCAEACLYTDLAAEGRRRGVIKINTPTAVVRRFFESFGLC